MIINKFGMRTLILAILLLSTICVLPATASIDQSIIEKNYVLLEDAKVHAKTALCDFLLIGAPGAKCTNWTNATVDPDPIIIYDANGRKLFYQFTVENNGINLGAIKVAANKVLGNPIRTIEFYSKDWNMKKEIENSKKLIAEDYKNANTTTAKVVCYSYPKMGIMLDMQETKSKEEKNKLFNFSGSEIIDKSTNNISSFGITDVWSLYSEIPEGEVEERLVTWDNYNKRAREIADNNFKEDQVQINLAGIQKVLSFTHYTQENSYYCAPATGKMIAKYYGVSHSQDYVAEQMETTPDVGTNLADQVHYYKYTLGKSGSYSDSTPTWIEAKNEIYANRPLSTLLSGHVRACAGYCQGNDGNYYLYIYDPWDSSFGNKYPGGIYWEDWDLISHKYHIYVKS